MKRWAIVWVLALLMTASASVLADDRSDIQELFNKVARAMSAKDPAGVMAVGTSDLIYIDKGKTLAGEQIARHMESRFRLMQGSPRCRVTILSVTVKGKGASALTTDVTEAEISGQSGRTHKVTATGRSRNTLVKTKNGWKLKTVYVVSSSMTMDGKPLSGSVL